MSERIKVVKKLAFHGIEGWDDSRGKSEDNYHNCIFLIRQKPILHALNKGNLLLAYMFLFKTVPNVVL